MYTAIQLGSQSGSHHHDKLFHSMIQAIQMIMIPGSRAHILCPTGLIWKPFIKLIFHNSATQRSWAMICCIQQTVLFSLHSGLSWICISISRRKCGATQVSELNERLSKEVGDQAASPPRESAHSSQEVSDIEDTSKSCLLLVILFTSRQSGTLCY